MNRKFGALSSSVNPQELSLSVTAAVRLILSVLVSFGVFSATGANTVIEQVPVLVGAGYAAFQAIELIWGVIRKLIVKFTAN